MKKIKTIFSDSTSDFDNKVNKELEKLSNVIDIKFTIDFPPVGSFYNAMIIYEE